MIKLTIHCSKGTIEQKISLNKSFNTINKNIKPRSTKIKQHVIITECRYYTPHHAR